jgi:hypothetical protein
LKRILKDIQGFKGRSRSFTVEIVRKGGSQPPQHHPRAPIASPARSPELPRVPIETPYPDPSEPHLEIPGKRPWEGGRILESVVEETPQIEAHLEPAPRKPKAPITRDNPEKPRKAKKIALRKPEKPPFEDSRVVEAKKTTKPRKRTIEEIIASLVDEPESNTETHAPLPAPEPSTRASDARKPLSRRAKIESPRWQQLASRWKERRGVRP